METSPPNFIEELVAPRTPAPAPTADTMTRVKYALTNLRARRKSTRIYSAYYDGRHPLVYASEGYQDYFGKIVNRYSENLSPAILDSISDRLQVTGVTLAADTAPEFSETPLQADGSASASDEAGADEPPEIPQESAEAIEAKRIAGEIWAIWQANRMNLRSGRVHKSAGKLGDAFVIVWPDPETAEPKIYAQDDEMVYVHYDPETEVTDWAAKFWRAEDLRFRVNIYTRETIERLETPEPVKNLSFGLPSDKTPWRPVGSEPVVDNPYDRVPVFHFANDADHGEYGRSELRDVIPIQDALNKSVADLLVAMEFAGYPQRWATGLVVENDPVTGKPREDFKPGIDRLWKAADEMAKFGEFTPADLDKFINASNRFKAAAADVCGVPAHYMQMTPGSWPSGESLKTAEARFVGKLIDRQNAFGNVWADVLTFCAAIAGIDLPQQIEVTWADASPRSELDAASIATLKTQIGVSNEQVQRELGYSEEEIARMRVESQVKADMDAERKAKEFNANPAFGEDA